MLANVKPENKTVFMNNLTAAGYQFTTEAKSKIVTVDCGDDFDNLLKMLTIEDK